MKKLSFGLVLFFLGVACSAKQMPQGGLKAPKSIKVTSSAFENMGKIPRKYTCEGENIAPPIKWEGLPKGTKSVALIVDDPDAPDPKAPKMVWVHWVVFNIPTGVSEIKEGGKLPAGAQAGVNDFKTTSYGGPCPPIGRHRYFFKVYALDTVLKGLKSPTKAELLEAMKGHVLAWGELIGTYKKGDK